MRERCPLSRAALDNESAVRHFEKADLDGNGLVSFAEFRQYLRERVLRKTVLWSDSTGDEAPRPHNLFDLVKNLSEEQCIEKLVKVAALNTRIWAPPAGVYYRS